MNTRDFDALAQRLGAAHSRRQLLSTATKGAIGGLGSALLSGGIGASGPSGPLVQHAFARDATPSPTPAGIHVRPNVHYLDPAGPELTAYATAVAKMKALPIEDPRNWLYQSYIHMFPPDDFGIPLPTDPSQVPAFYAALGAFLARPGRKGWFTCEHGTSFFWPWHRMQLYWFERIVRDLGEYPDFALPYWDYFDPAQRTLPEPFRTPADPANPLWVELRDPDLNAGGVPPLSPRDENAVFGNQCAGFAGTDFFLASDSLEGVPHNQVHGWVGGGFANPPMVGMMSSPLTSAQDPIFWFHHANMDRLWESWLALGNANPPETDVAWRDNDSNSIGNLGLPYAFFDETGAEVSTIRVVREVLSATDLGYAYEELFDPVAAMCPEFSDEVISPASPSAGPPAVPSTPEALGTNAPAESIAVGPDPVAIPVTLEQPEAGPEAVSSGRTVVLTIESVHGEGVPGTIFEVYANLPPDQAPDFRSVYFVGYITLFGLQPWDGVVLHGAHQAADQRFDITRTVAALEVRGEWTGEFTVTIVPYHAPSARAIEAVEATPGAVAATPVAVPPGPWVTFESISVTVQ